MIKLNTILITITVIGLSYGSAFAQDDSNTSDSATSAQLSDDAYLALANSEAFNMFADDPAPLVAQDGASILVLGSGQLSSSLYCAIDALAEMSEGIGTDQSGVLFVEVGDIMPYFDSDDCFENDAAITITLAKSTGS